MKNNKIFSTLLLATTLTAMVAGALSVNKNVYHQADAAGSYKIIYLDAPNAVKDNKDTNEIVWDADNDLYVYESGNDEIPMGKVTNHLYTCIINSNSSNQFNFVARVGGELKYAVEPGQTLFKYNDFGTYTVATLKKYNVGNRVYAADINSNHTISNALEFANTFAGVFHSTCKDAGDSDFDKLKFAWGKMNEFYLGLSDGDKSSLKNADKDDPSDPLKDFAALYDYVYWKYGNYDGFGSDFISRGIDPRQVGKYVSSNITDNSVTTNVVVVSSISLVSLSIIGIYFYIRKRKEDK